MANYINMQQSEYDEVQQKLEALRSEIISGEADIRQRILELTEIEGGFYVEMISEKIGALLNELSWGAMRQRLRASADSKAAIEAFVDAIVQIDVVDM